MKDFIKNMTKDDVYATAVVIAFGVFSYFVIWAVY